MTGGETWTAPWGGAERTLSRRQVAAAALVALACVAGVVAWGAATVLAVIVGLATLLFASTTYLRLAYLFAGRRSSGEGALLAAAPLGAPLPRYTVMAALYHEAAVVQGLLESLAQLDYPADRLEVLLLVEHDDPETEAACRAHLRPGWSVVVVPPGVPRTKPRALNHGLGHTTGEFFTIYDAEDRPDADQLLKAVSEFRRLPQSVAALQARLDFYNSRQNALTRWFTCDYATHFGLLLSGIAHHRHPLPLGGTSTHFRTDVIRRVGGWDAWNVTEDCELGMRLAAAGFVSLRLASVTMEEAVPRLRPWVRQRSRWVKGYAQTGLQITRAPVRSARAMGLRPYLSALGIVAAAPVALVAQIVFWAVLAVYVVLRVSGADVSPIERVFPEPLLTLGMVSLIVGNFVVLAAHVAEIYHLRRHDLVAYAVAMPIYWTLASIAAWRGVLQLLWSPHFWEKTEHGMGGAADVGHLPAAVLSPSRTAPPRDGGAVLELLVRHGRTYPELAVVLGLPEAEVRRLALEALDRLHAFGDSRVEPEWYAPLADYVLGQDAGSGELADHLERAPDARAWVASVRRELERSYRAGGGE